MFLCIEEKHQLLQQAQLDRDKSKVNATRQKLESEKTAWVYQNLHNIQGTMAAGITQLQVPQDCNNHNHINCKEWVFIDTPQEIKHYTYATATESTLVKHMAVSPPSPHSPNGWTGELPLTWQT